MNKFYETVKKLYDTLRGGSSRRTISSKDIKHPLQDPSEFYDNDGIELGTGGLVAADSDRVTRGIEGVFDVPEGEVEGVSQEHIINYWRQR